MGDQELVEERFQADVLKLDQHYQRELRALSESHEEQRRHWEAQMQEAFENAEEHRRVMEEEMEQERESLNREWTKERRELESLHKEELDKVIVRNRQQQKDLEDFVSSAQTKEIELSRQLNDLHNRLQESLEIKDELLAQSESKALQAELLLSQMVEDFKQERTEHLSNQLELEARYNEMLGISEGQITERIGLLTERDDLKMKIEELELLLKQAAEDFELERKELQEHASVLEEKLKDNVENEKDDLIAEREMFTRRIQALEEELDQVSTSMENDEKTEMRGSNDLVTFTEGNENVRESISFSGEEQKTCQSPENHIDDFVESSNEELVCSSLFLDETVMDSLDAEHRGPENILNVCQEYDNEAPAADDDSEDPEQDNEMAPTENISEESENQDDSDSQTGELLPDEAEEDAHVSCCSTETGLCSEEGTNSNHRNIENKKESVSVETQCEAASSLEVFEDEDSDEDAVDGEKQTARASCEDESKPQDDSGSFSHEDGPGHETVAEPPVLGETGDPGELSLEDPEVNVLPNNSHRYKQEAELVSDSDCEHLTADRKDERADCSHDCLQHLEKDGDCENQDAKLQGLYSTATEENVLLHEKISLLQQKTEILESLLAHNTEKIKTGHQVLEENYNLKVKMVLLMEHVKGLEIKALKMTDLQIRYEDCMCENAKLKEQNCELEKSVWSLETRMNIFHDFQDEQLSLVDEISRMREENARLSGLFGELEQQYETLPAMHPDAGRSQSPTGEDSLDLTSQPEVKVQAVSDLENCCEEFEKQNSKLRRAVTELQDKSQTLDETTQAHR